MTNFCQSIWLVAQEAAPAGGQPVAGGGEQGGGFGLSMLPSLIVIFVLFYFMLLRPERSKQKTHQAMLEGIKTNDRVLTTGGIYGVVTNVQRDKAKITLRVDESNGTKMDFSLAAIAQVIGANTEESK